MFLGNSESATKKMMLGKDRRTPIGFARKIKKMFLKKESWQSLSQSRQKGYIPIARTHGLTLFTDSRRN
jgi:hypothetical protein